MRVNNKSGFTLLEIIIVVIIMGILGSILIPQFTGMVSSAELAAQKQSAAGACSAAAAKSTLLRAFNEGASNGLSCPATGSTAQFISCTNSAGQNITCSCGNGNATCRWTN